MKSVKEALFVIFSSILVLLTHPTYAQLRESKSVVNVSASASKNIIKRGEAFDIQIRLDIEPGWHINSNQPDSDLLIPTEVDITENPLFVLKKVEYPQGIRKSLSIGTGVLRLYESSTFVNASFAASSDAPKGEASVVGKIIFQACSQDQCLVPSTVDFSVPIEITEGSRHDSSESGLHIIPNQEGGVLKGMFSSANIWLIFLAAFLSGLLLNLTPCVYPMIPVTVAFFSQQASGKSAKIFRLGLFYVFGLSLSYALLGLIAAKTGSLVGSWLSHPFVLFGIFLLMLVLSLSLFGLYELSLPSWILRKFGNAASGVLGAILMGACLGLFASPCLGPFILGLLVLVGNMGNPLLGFLILFVVGIGMGFPYIFIGVLASRISSMPKSGQWLIWVKKLLGVILIWIGFSFLRSLLIPALFRAILIMGLSASGLYLGWFEASRGSSAFRIFRRLVGIALLASAIISAAWIPKMDSLIEWRTYSKNVIEEAVLENKPVLVDIYADWCVPCVEMDMTTFRDARVANILSQMIPIRIDATGSVAPEEEAFFDEYGIFGVPTMLFFDSNGKEKESLRVSGYISPDELLGRLSVFGFIYKDETGGD